MSDLAIKFRNLLMIEKKGEVGYTRKNVEVRKKLKKFSDEKFFNAFCYKEEDNPKEMLRTARISF